MRLWGLLFLSIVLGSSNWLNAKTFIRDYSYRASDADSKITARSIALNQVKTLLLEEIGVYIESSFEDTAIEGKAGEQQLTKQQIISITAGVTETNILEERWDGATYYLKAKIEANIDDVKKKVQEIAKDREKTKELNEAREKAETALTQIRILQSKLAKSEDEKEKYRLQAEYNKNSSELTAADWFLMGKNASASKDTTSAILYYQRTIEVDPEYYRAYINLGAEYAEKGYLDDAIKYFTKAIDINPKEAAGYSNLGAAYAQQGYLDKALVILEKAISINPEIADTYANIGLVHWQKGNREKAIRFMKQAANLGHPASRKYLTDQGIVW